ncbi:HNH endonuclease [Bradyrhizobium sp. USDA 223]|uniref:HNH endonuclease n=1 Tax=Bradyrhizobium sp. USDA 223 TaxID=3156306 RepID=UPI003833CE08
MVNYEKHLRSAAWRESRRRALAAAHHRCLLCSATEELEAHHRTYENLGDEREGDLTVLCRECHEVVTSMMRARRYAARPASYADIVRSIAASAPLFDPTDGEV